MFKRLLSSSSPRTAKAKKNVIVSLGVKGISILISLAFVPLLLSNLNTERYGIWLTLTSVLSWMSFFDIGLGNGLKNQLASCFANNDQNGARKAISTAYLSMGIITCINIVVFIIVSNYINWDVFLNSPISMRGELKVLVTCVVCFFFIQLWLNLICTILDSLQMPSLTGIISTFGQLLAFILVFAVSRIDNQATLLIYGICISISPVVVIAISTALIFFKTSRHLAPSFKLYDKTLVKRMFSLGAKFLLIQLTAIMLYQTNNFVIAHIVGDSDVTYYNIAFKYAGIIQMIFTIIISPIWVASADAYTKGDILWIKNIINKLNKIWLLFFFISIILVLAAPYVYELWLGKDIKIDPVTTSLLFVYFLLSMKNGIYCNIINGFGKITLQFYLTAIEVVIHISLSIFLGKILGSNGVIISMCLIMLLNYIWMPLQCNRILNGTAKGIWNK